MKWNFVKDKLPELKHEEEYFEGGTIRSSDRVLVAGYIDSIWFNNEEWHMATAEFCRDCDENGNEGEGYWYFGFDVDGPSLDSGDIVAWMPLPSPPMEKRP